MKFISSLAITSIALSVFALAQGSADQNKMSKMSPKDVCSKLVDSLKAKVSSSQMDQWVYSEGQTQSQAQKQQKMQAQADWLKKELSSVKCTDETIAGNHAFVVAKASDHERLVPFIKQGDMWKLDTKSYHAIYRMDQRVPASESGKSQPQMMEPQSQPQAPSQSQPQSQ